ncbi:beta-galactosidase [uncultured Microbacterium sp.]|uniref:beta-galactosidase n=1 Tax=uncultured Microbacterium sp. TaxID=191216 RepID=UPI002609DA66|nr:beta-galactosidase [uncultured Microbacterium sp.]
MNISSSTTVRHRGWTSPAGLAAMPAPGEAARGLTVTDRAVLRDGVGFVPVSGELHYSRLPRARWGERLRQVRAAGITLASTYVIWNHHSSARGDARFAGNLDVGAFVDEVEAAGLELILRIGPWVHGEVRNGGFPDWVQDAAIEHRSDDPAYLELVTEWFDQLAGALAGRARPGGPIVGIQLENELYDRPEHLVTLKRLAREAGMSAPLWTATAWGGAKLPDGEVFPLFSGYADGFWADPEDDWHPSFRAHFFFSHEWDDPGVGADVRATQGFADSGAIETDLHGFPPATCELGSGMATAYHRRPVLDANDIAALANVTIGNGSAWQGYFMYVGGVNPAPDLQESHATAYPNDMPEFGYDFHAPIGQSGDLHASAAPLRAQHAFLAAFGDRLAEMTSTLPDELPDGQSDRSTLRWALRSDGDQGVVVISQHQPHEPVSAVDAALRVTLDSAEVVFPPVTIPSGTIARWPVAWRVGGSRIEWATASLLTELPGAVPTLVLVAESGIEPRVSIDGDVHTGVGMFDAEGGRILVLPESDAGLLWVRDAPEGRALLRTADELAWSSNALLHRGARLVEVFDGAVGAWRALALPAAEAPASLALTPRLVTDPHAVATDHGFRERRHCAPSRPTIDGFAAVYSLDLPEGALSPDADAVIDIDWAGDVAEVRVDGHTVDDRFWDGERWSVSVVDAGIHPGSNVTLHVLPLSARTTIGLPAAARARIGTEQLCALDAVVVRERGSWRRVDPT